MASNESSPPLVVKKRRRPKKPKNPEVKPFMTHWKLSTCNVEQEAADHPQQMPSSHISNASSASQDAGDKRPPTGKAQRKRGVRIDSEALHLSSPENQNNSIQDVKHQVANEEFLVANRSINEKLIRIQDPVEQGLNPASIYTVERTLLNQEESLKKGVSPQTHPIPPLLSANATPRPNSGESALNSAHAFRPISSRKRQLSAHYVDPVVVSPSLPVWSPASHLATCNEHTFQDDAQPKGITTFVEDNQEEVPMVPHLRNQSYQDLQAQDYSQQQQQQYYQQQSVTRPLPHLNVVEQRYLPNTVLKVPYARYHQMQDQNLQAEEHHLPHLPPLQGNRHQSETVLEEDPINQHYQYHPPHHHHQLQQQQQQQQQEEQLYDYQPLVPQEEEARQYEEHMYHNKREFITNYQQQGEEGDPFQSSNSSSQQNLPHASFSRVPMTAQLQQQFAAQQAQGDMQAEEQQTYAWMSAPHSSKRYKKKS